MFSDVIQSACHNKVLLDLEYIVQSNETGKIKKLELAISYNDFKLSKCQISLKSNIQRALNENDDLLFYIMDENSVHHVIVKKAGTVNANKSKTHSLTQIIMLGNGKQ